VAGVLKKCLNEDPSSRSRVLLARRCCGADEAVAATSTSHLSAPFATFVRASICAVLHGRTRIELAACDHTEQAQ
jgi:hypothetical protein